MLVCCNNICGTVLKWYEIQARYFNCPLFILDTPFCHTGFSAEAKRYVRRQIEDYIVFLEEVCGKKMDRDRMEEVGRLSVEGQQIWQEVLDTAMNQPSPLTAFDAFFHLALIVTLRGPGRPSIIIGAAGGDEDRAAHGIGAVPNEKYRLLWDNIPIWYRMKWLSDKFASLDACLVADTYTWPGVVPSNIW
jgi:benzoyl-CoA reductase/2-hydroxyglutaryl-CoA dehydratase subunit BcrC/BadD/HgdB